MGALVGKGVGAEGNGVAGLLGGLIGGLFGREGGGCRGEGGILRNKECSIKPFRNEFLRILKG